MKLADYTSTQVLGAKKSDDKAKYKEGMLPSKINIWTGAALDAVQFECGDVKLEKHGGNGGGYKSGLLKEGQYIKKVRVTANRFSGNKVLTAIAFYDQNGNLIAGNVSSGDSKELVAGEGECICALCADVVWAGGTNVLSGIGIYTCELPNVKDLLNALGSVKSASMAHVNGPFAEKR